MPVRMQCPSCSAVASYPDPVRGKSARTTCKKCGEVFSVKSSSGGDEAVSSVKARSTSKTSPARARGDFDFDDAPPPRWCASGKSSGNGVLWLLFGCIGAAAVVVCLLLVLLLTRPAGDNKTLAQIPPIIGQLPNTENPPKGVPPFVPPIVPSKDGKKEPPPEDKKPPEPPFNPLPVVEKPPVPIPKIQNPSKTRDGAMTLAAHPEMHLRFMAVSPDGKTLYTAAWDNQLRIWDAATFDQKAELPLPKPEKLPNSRLQATLSADGKNLVFAHWDILQIMDLESKKIDVFEGMPKEEHSLGQIVLSADGNTALTRWATVTYALWRVPERKFVGKLQYDGIGLARNNASILAVNGSSWLHAPHSNNAAHLRALPDLRDLGTFSGPEKLSPFDAASYSTWAPTLSPSGKLLAYALIGKGSRRIRVFDAAQRNMVLDMPLTKYSKEVLDPEVSSIAISPDEKLLVALDSHRWLHGYDLTTGAFLGVFVFPLPNPYGTGGDDERVVRFTNDGRRLIAGACNLVKIWERDTLVWLNPLDPATQPQRAVVSKELEKPPVPPPPQEPEFAEYKNALLKDRNELDYYFEVDGKIIRTQGQLETAWRDTTGIPVAPFDPKQALLQNKGNVVNFRTRRVSGRPHPLLVEVRVVKLAAEMVVQPGSIELKGARIAKYQKPHVWLNSADGKEFHAVIIGTTFVKDQTGKDLEFAERFKIFKVGNTVDAVVAPLEQGMPFSNMLSARLVKE